MKSYDTADIGKWARLLRAGDEILLSGTIYTARDAAHKKFFELLDTHKALPFDLKGAIIYYTGPTPAKKNMAVGSCGPTTSARMDIYTPRLLDMGLGGMIGKGGRSKEVVDSIKRNGAVYLCAVGGAGALASMCVKESRVIAFDELGCESVKRFIISDFPLFVGIDSRGGSIFIN